MCVIFGVMFLFLSGVVAAAAAIFVVVIMMITCVNMHMVIYLQIQN